MHIRGCSMNFFSKRLLKIYDDKSCDLVRYKIINRACVILKGNSQ